jgi:hypothetical protein
MLHSSLGVWVHFVKLSTLFFCAPADFKLSDLIVIQNKMLCQLLLLYIHKITIKTVNVHCSCYVIAVMPVIGMVATSTFLRSFRQEMFEDDPPT